MLLESKSKFDIRSPSKERPMSPESFFNWSNNHMYRTSYNDMKINVSNKSGIKINIEPFGK